MRGTIDARGLSCPEPVVLTRNRMKECDEIEIIVDNETAVENLKRLASSSGWSFQYAGSGNNFTIIIKNSTSGVSASVMETRTSGGTGGTVVVFSSDKMGRGDDELGAVLMKAFMHTLATSDTVPDKVIFYNSGVLLTAEGSGVTDDIELLQQKNATILICGTCVNYFDIGKRIKTGTISNMFEILNTMNNAVRIINP